jgi:hypothetical protein
MEFVVCLFVFEDEWQDGTLEIGVSYVSASDFNLLWLFDMTTTEFDPLKPVQTKKKKRKFFWTVLYAGFQTVFALISVTSFILMEIKCWYNQCVSN